MKRYFVQKETRQQNILVPDEFSYSAMGMWENYTHKGILYIYTVGNYEGIVERLTKINAKDCLTRVSRCQNGILVRVLSDSGDKIYKMFQKMGEII